MSKGINDGKVRSKTLLVWLVSFISCTIVLFQRTTHLSICRTLNIANGKNLSSALESVLIPDDCFDKSLVIFLENSLPLPAS